MRKRLSDFTALTFDVYGTLIDWESGMLAELRPWTQRNGLRIDDARLLAAFGEIESDWETRHPSMPYIELLAEVHKALAAKLGAKPDEAAARGFAASVRDWPTFPDTLEALNYLARHFRLFVLSNIDNDSIRRSMMRMSAPFSGVFTAQDIGSYKPDQRNFLHARAEMSKLGFAPEKHLHVAQSLFHDHEPCGAVGIASAWIVRPSGRATGAVRPPLHMPKPAFRFDTLNDMAEAHRAELAGA